MHSSWYDEGYNAFYNHKDENECPYDELSEPYNEWQSGWTFALTEYEKDIGVFSE